MMIALAYRVENEIASNYKYGDRTGQWFWTMIHNLGLTGMRDSDFDRDYVDTVITRLLNREYEPDGTGGLFRVRDCEYDMRSVEIWCQFSWYLQSIK